MPYKFDEKQSIFDNKQSKQFAQQDFIHFVYQCMINPLSPPPHEQRDLIILSITHL